MMSASEHVQWTKDRALAELGPGGSGVAGAIASVISDLGKHPETRGHSAIELMGLLMLNGHLDTPAKVREFVDGIR